MLVLAAAVCDRAFVKHQPGSVAACNSFFGKDVNIGLQL